MEARTALRFSQSFLDLSKVNLSHANLSNINLSSLFGRNARRPSRLAIGAARPRGRHFPGRTLLRRVLLAAALATASVPAWCVADGAAAAPAPKTVNINTADAATLAEALKGVGLSKAEAIIAYRKEHGGFKTVEQLSEVKGIGEKLVKANQDRIVVK